VRALQTACKGDPDKFDARLRKWRSAQRMPQRYRLAYGASAKLWRSLTRQRLEGRRMSYSQGENRTREKRKASQSAKNTCYYVCKPSLLQIECKSRKTAFPSLYRGNGRNPSPAHTFSTLFTQVYDLHMFTQARVWRVNPLKTQGNTVQFARYARELRKRGNISGHKKGAPLLGAPRGKARGNVRRAKGARLTCN